MFLECPLRVRENVDHTDTVSTTEKVQVWMKDKKTHFGELRGGARPFSGGNDLMFGWKLGRQMGRRRSRSARHMDHNE